jgi:SET domain-containing protein
MAKTGNQRQTRVRSPRLFVASSKIHGLGLFAGENIDWGRRLIEFQGAPLSRKEVARRQRFYDSIGFTCLIQFGDGQGVDGAVGGNESRFINHSLEPNVGAIREGDWGVVFYSLTDIAKGEELTFNYGFDPSATGSSQRRMSVDGGV